MKTSNLTASFPYNSACRYNIPKPTEMKIKPYLSIVDKHWNVKCLSPGTHKSLRIAD